MGITVNAKKYVYFFGNGRAEGSARMKDLLGSKGANLAEMTNIGTPVPPGFTITTEACIHYYANDGGYPDGLEAEIDENLARLEGLTKKRFGDAKNPLLLSVRSGAAISMPGMMDTVLNIGLTDESVAGIARGTGNERFAYDSYRRFVQMFGNVVLGMKHSDFEQILEEKKQSRGVTMDTELDSDDLKELVSRYKELVEKETGRAFPEDPKEQLRMTIDAVFESWNTDRAITYRALNNISQDLGTGVNVQMMVFGNMGADSGTGVCFTRDPATGENMFYGEYLMNAQGEDVVAGLRTPETLDQLEAEMPDIYGELAAIREKLEKHYRDVQDMEFTIESGTLYMLQTRTGKRTAQAAVKTAVDMVAEGLIDKETAILRVEPDQLDQLLHPMIDPKATVDVLAKGLAASPGAAVGKVVFSSHRAMELAEKGEKVILVRLETSPDDVGGMAASQGILTARGGMTSHAAIVGRGMGKCCVVGCNEIDVDGEAKRFTVGGTVVNEGDYITLDGTKGDVILGVTDLVEPEMTGDFGTLMDWASRAKRLGVRTNADAPHDSEVARNFGAEGIGLCRTEHMFFGEERLPIVQQMILACDEASRRVALDKLMPMQKEDFKGIFEVMKDLPVTIRLLDPPLHEFLPKTEEDVIETALRMDMKVDELKSIIQNLHEVNPMLGHRGCRLGITYPEIYEMQVQAIFEAACELAAGRDCHLVIPEIMIPLVGHINELRFTKERLVETANTVMERYGTEIEYMVGTMIEVPRAAVTADEIATEAEFFSFGTNDLTQMTFGFSRDDVGKFLPFYVKEGILASDPFVTIDQTGVGKLVEMGAQKGRSTKPDLKIGICGEHGGNPASVEFCHRTGLDYVSCSPFRIPIAILAAAQAAVKEMDA
ncbi:MAG: pyruvate, phosphate dikinase [Candidatus Methanogaster sp.]|uniref:Pyruvate, phosphate dikinase n=1 Tax=Candidatus Methanogaster sp. TaxID=3386292 RepID=A0AC61L5X5_9EURY|nr:MAG: pyruvate, phosphate dikinase [ANME-2 cluster archaeon]